MDVHFKDSFFESLEKLVWYDTKLWKAWEFIRRGIPNFFRNAWYFRRELKNHYWWDYHFTLQLMHRSLTDMKNGLETKGMEVDESRLKKVEAIDRALTLIKSKLDDDYIGRAESELGEVISRDWEFKKLENGNYEMIDTNTDEENAHNRKVFDRAREIEEADWKELWEIFKGTKFSKKYGKKYDGTDMRAWWD